MKMSVKIPAMYDMEGSMSFEQSFAFNNNFEFAQSSTETVENTYEASMEITVPPYTSLTAVYKLQKADNAKVCRAIAVLTPGML